MLVSSQVYQHIDADFETGLTFKDKVSSTAVVECCELGGFSTSEVCAHALKGLAAPVLFAAAVVTAANSG